MFQEAYDKARSRFSNEAWLALNPREITAAIYKEMRRLDAERAAAMGLVPKANRADPPLRKRAAKAG